LTRPLAACRRLRPGREHAGEIGQRRHDRIDTVPGRSWTGSGTPMDVQEIHHQDKAHGAQPDTACSASTARYRDQPLFMITVMPRATPMIQGYPQHVPGSVDKGVNERFLRQPADNAIQDAEEQEASRHLREPPPPGGMAMPRSSQGSRHTPSPRRQEKEHQDHLCRVVNFQVGALTAAASP